jgi:membrane-bound serine protease (ClpP class)
MKNQDDVMELIAALFAAGGLLMLLELFLPGMIAGIAGFICLVSGVALTYSRFGVMAGNWALAGVVLALIVGFLAWLKFFPSSRFAGFLISRRAIGDVGAEKPELLEQTGVAQTPLRPSGVAMINGKRVDVITEGSMIDRGSSVKVIAIEGMRVVVRAV